MLDYCVILCFKPRVPTLLTYICITLLSHPGDAQFLSYTRPVSPSVLHASAGSSEGEEAVGGGGIEEAVGAEHALHGGQLLCHGHQPRVTCQLLQVLL